MDLSDREARSRDELICPDCRIEGLDRYPAFARRKDDPREKIIHGTKCPQCETRVAPADVEKQLADPEWSLGGLSFSVPSVLRNFSKRTIAIGLGLIVFLAAFLWLPMMSGPIFGGSSATDGLSAPTEIYSEGNWTIYKGPNGYYITNGEQYLTPDGLSDDPRYFDDEDYARRLLDAYLEYLANRDSGNQTSGSGTQTTTPTFEYESPTGTTATPEINFGTPTTTEIESGGGGGGGGSTGGATTPTDSTSVTTEPLHGQVLDSTGEPIAGANVVIPDVTTATAGSDGTYNLSSKLDSGTYRIYATNGSLSTQPFEISVTSTGRIEVAGSPDQAMFVEDADGYVAQNQLHIMMPAGGAAKNITLFGTGSFLENFVRFENPDNADSASITLTGIKSSVPRQQFVPSTANNVTFDIFGNSQPRNPTLSVNASAATRLVTNVGQVTGDGTASVSNDGDVATTLDVTVSGKQWHTLHRKTGSAPVNESKILATVGGDAAPTGIESAEPTLVLTGKEKTLATYDGNSFSTYHDRVHRDQTWSDIYVLFQPYVAGTYRFNYTLYANAYDGSSTVRLVRQTGDDYGYPLGINESASTEDYEGNSNTETGVFTHTFTEEDLEPDDTSGWFPENYDAIGMQVSAYSDCTGYNCNPESSASLDKVERIAQTGDVTVTAGGKSYTINDLGTETVSLSDKLSHLEPGDSVTIKTNGKAGVEYEFRWSETHYTEDVQVQDDTGSTVETVSGPLAPGQTQTVTVPESKFDSGKTVTLRSPSGKFGYNLSYTQAVLPDSATISVNGETYQYPQAFADTDDNTINISSLTLGENTVSIDVATTNGLTPTLNATFNYQGKVVQTNQPEVTVISANGSKHVTTPADNALDDGKLTETVTINLPQSWFTTGENTIRVKTADQSEVEARFTAFGLYQQIREFDTDK